MKNDFSDYLEKTVGLTELFLERAQDAIKFYNTLYPDRIENIFVSEYIDGEGKRQYESLWIFTGNLAGEAKQFLTEDSFDSTPLKNRVVWWELKRTDFDGEKATDDSRMTIRVTFDTDIEGILKASGENCMQLQKIFNQHLFQNLQK